MKKITVLVSDDHPVVRQGLRLLLEAAEDIAVVGEAENGHDAVRKAVSLHPEVVLLDIAMPLLNGVEAARQIAREVPLAKVLILSAYTHHHYVQDAIDAGVAGYLMKETAANDLLEAVREIAKGNAFFSPPIAQRFLKQWQETFSDGQPVRTKAAGLTRREAEVLQLIAESYSTKQISGLLSISKKTVEKHRQALMDKLNIHKIAPLTRYAVSAGIVDLNQAPAWSISRFGASVREHALVRPSKTRGLEDANKALAGITPRNTNTQRSKSEVECRP